ncbi:hypothetical protein COCVIDRAFT_29190 [Bipolaris victoriae FI3]|uniref:NADP-dependent oxidoreductase domain-containing protein n=1 Tax=Bipolaris victoriae (strain FI3) TaxID=930091 RepID=W7E7E0_BIPV3|nr:hypothetical protein COCVIDRAFT_29190 [Bipolaris victoriae FI3]
MVKIVFGGFSLSDQAYFKILEERNQAVNLLLKNGVNNIDTAHIYPGSEYGVGQLEKRKEFTIDTKLPGGSIPGSITKDGVIKYLQESLRRLQIDHIDVLYIHTPDDSVPIEQTLEGINEAYKKGAFRRFGLSNYTAKQVQEVYDIAKAKGYLLLQLSINFYAYSAIAGGFLTKSIADLDAGVGRFNKNVMGGLFSMLYDHEHLREALFTWNYIARKEGVSNAELAYRWVAYHSALHGDEDGILLGVSKLSQIEQTIQGIKKGKLSDEAVKAIEVVWENIKRHPPVGEMNDVVASVRDARISLE